MVRELHRQATAGRTLPLAIIVEGRFAGQITVSNIIGGSARYAQIGYWIDRALAGRGITPVAVALVIDYCFGSLDLHRIEIAIRPENTASLRVVEKLQIAQYGHAPSYLHIDGQWRDHRLFAITKEECPGGLLRRLSH